MEKIKDYYYQNNTALIMLHISELVVNYQNQWKFQQVFDLIFIWKKKTLDRCKESCQETECQSKKKCVFFYDDNQVLITQDENDLEFIFIMIEHGI